MTAPAWMTAAEAAAFERGTTAADAADDAADAGVAHHTPAQPTFDPTYRPQVRPTAPSAPYHPPKRNPLDPWWDRYIVDVEDVDGQVVSFSVAGERLGDDGAELFGHHFNEVSGRPTDVEVSFPIDRIRMIVVP